MSIRYVDNVSRYVDVGESFSLPSQLVATRENGQQSLVSVSWSPSTVNTSQEGEYLFIGSVPNYSSKVILSLQVGYGDRNPQSVFPSFIDSFPDVKEDIVASKIEAYDEYQFLKAKIPRMFEDIEKLRQLRTQLDSNIVWAKDINHIRNCLVAIEEYLLQIEQDGESRLDSIENDIELIKIELTNIETDIENIKQTIENIADTVIRDIKEMCFNGVSFLRRTENGKIIFKGLTGTDVNITTSNGCLVISDE